MKELITLWDSNSVLVSVSTWIMSMSLMNIGMLFLIIILFFGTELTVSVNNVKRKTPKHFLSILTLILIFIFPNTLWIATLPFVIVVFLLIFWTKAIFIYLNFFMPAGHKKVI